MGTDISWQVELAVKPGQLENFRALTKGTVETTRREQGALLYERFVSGDGRMIYVYERYADSAAAVAHLQTFAATYGERFAKMVDRKRFTVFGIPSEELKRMLDGLGATYLTPFEGFSCLR